MRFIAIIMLACLAVRALQLALAVFVVGVIIAVAVGIIVRPRETLGCIVVTGLWSLLERHPVQTLCVLAALSALSWLEVAIKKMLTETKARDGRNGEQGGPFEPARLPPP